MNSKSPVKISAIFFLLIALLSLNSCNVSSTKMEFSFNTSVPSNFIIELHDVKANNEYLFKIETIQSKNGSIILTSNNKLVKYKEKPEKYIIEKK